MILAASAMGRVGEQVIGSTVAISVTARSTRALARWRASGRSNVLDFVVDRAPSAAMTEPYRAVAVHGPGDGDFSPCCFLLTSSSVIAMTLGGDPDRQA